MSAWKRAAPPVLAAFVSLLSSHPLAAAPAWHDGPDGSGYEVFFGEAEEAEKLLFIAACDAPGLAVHIWYLAQRTWLPGQTTDARGLRRPVDPLAATLVIDGRRFTFDDARAEPEETYDANEIVLLLSAGDPLFTALGKGSQLTLEIDGAVGDNLSLKGSFGPFARLVAFCRDR